MSFIPRPGAEEEDDGVLISTVMGVPEGRSYLLVLDGKTLEKIVSSRGRSRAGIADGDVWRMDHPMPRPSRTDAFDRCMVHPHHMSIRAVIRRVVPEDQSYPIVPKYCTLRQPRRSHV